MASTSPLRSLCNVSHYYSFNVNKNHHPRVLCCNKQQQEPSNSYMHGVERREGLLGTIAVGALLISSNFAALAEKGQTSQVVITTLPTSRRSAILMLSAASLVSLHSYDLSSALARERRNKKNIPLEDYLTTPDGLKYYDVKEGKGPVAEKGSTVLVHFDCLYRGITAVSSRESKLLAGNRIIAQPYEFKVGSPPGKERKREFVDNPNGLFSAQAAPKPPPAMYSVTEGMKVGGKRTVIVPPEAGYGQKGMNEIPPGGTFELNIELLEVMPPERNQP